jgi:magnesium-transporting ATPase (P-type)
VAQPLLTFASFLAGRALGGGVDQTMAFATLALAELALVYGMRSFSIPAWRLPSNLWLDLSVLASAAVVVAAIYLPGADSAFATVALGAPAAAIVVALALVPLAGVELAKAWERRPRAAPPAPRPRQARIRGRSRAAR